jgi:hypothetical protein
LLRTIANDAAGQRKAFLQLLYCGGRPIFLKEAQQRAADHDGKDNSGIDPLLEYK